MASSPPTNRIRDTQTSGLDAARLSDRNGSQIALESQRWKTAVDSIFFGVRHILGGGYQALGQQPSSDEWMTRYIASFSVPLATGRCPPELVEGSGLMSAVMRKYDGTRVYFTAIGEPTSPANLQFGGTDNSLSRCEQPHDPQFIDELQPREFLRSSRGATSSAHVAVAADTGAPRDETEPRRKRRRRQEHEGLDRGHLASNSDAVNVRRQRNNMLSSADVWEVAVRHAFGIVRAFIQGGDPGYAVSSEIIGRHGCAASLVVQVSSIDAAASAARSRGTSASAETGSVPTTTSEVGECSGAVRRSAKLTLLVRFSPPTWHEESNIPTATGTTAVTLEICEASTANDSLRGLCSCDELAEFRPREESSPCAHVEYAFHEIRPVASRVSAVGLRIRECLTKAEGGFLNIPEVRDSMALVRLLPTLRFIGSRKVTSILLWCRGGLAVPVYKIMKTRRNGQAVTVFECQRCRGTANRRGACDHELDAERHSQRSESATCARSHEIASLHASGCDADGNTDQICSCRAPQRAVDEPTSPPDDMVENAETSSPSRSIASTSAAARAAGQTWSDDHEQFKNTLRHSAYVSRWRRSPFPCASDFIASVHLRSLIDESLPGPVAFPELVDNRAKCYGQKDDNSLCFYLSTAVASETKFASRAMLLHGFTSRHLRVFVRDWICPQCSNVVRYDGFDDGLFSSSSTHLWSRTAMDAFLAGSLRFSASGRATAGISAELERARSYGDKLEDADRRLSETPGRKQQSDAAAAYLALLGDPQGRPGAMGRVFRCESGCEGLQGPKIVIGDGTAAGIFKDLPAYDRPSEFLAPLPTSLSSRQYMLHAKHERESVRFLCRRALSRQVATASDVADASAADELEAVEIPLDRLCTEGKPCRPETRRKRSEAILDMLTATVSRTNTRSTSNRRSILEQCRLKLGDGNVTEHAIADFSEHRRLLFRPSWSDEVAHDIAELSYAAVSIFLQQMFELTEFESISEQTLLPQAETESAVQTEPPTFIGSAARQNVTTRAPEAPQAHILEAAGRNAGGEGSAPAQADSASLAMSGSLPLSLPAPLGVTLHRQAAIGSDETAGNRVAAGTAIASSDPESGGRSRRESGTGESSFVRPLLPDDELRRASYNLALSCCADSPHVFLMEKSAQSEALAFAAILGSLSKVASPVRAQSVAQIGFAAVQSSRVPFIRGFMVALSVSLQNQAVMSTVWPQLQRLCEAVCWILRSSVLTVYSYEETYKRNAHDSCKAYESLHMKGENGPSGALEDSFLEASRTGHLYPGRTAMRPAIEFSADPIASCNKEYPVSRALSPGLLIFCCGCQNPIIQGLSAMTAAEARSFMWSVVLAYLLTESLEFVFYDNACGLRQSVVSRALWSLRKTRLLVDRFHIQGHVCGPAFDAEVMHVANNSSSSSVECVNALIGAIKASMRYIRPENYLAFSGLRALLLNVSAKWRKLTGLSDCDTADLSVLGNILMPCGCHRCEDGRASSDCFRAIEAELHSERRILNHVAVSSASVARAMEHGRRRSLATFGSRSWYNPYTGRMVRPGALD